MDDKLTANGEVDLAELHQGVIDDEALERYFADLELAEVFDVLVKGAPEEYAREGRFSLETGQKLFVEKVVRGLQIRYRYDDAEWWDTLIRTPDGTRLVRVRHDFSDL